MFGAVLNDLGQVFGDRTEAGRPTTRGGALAPQVTLAVAGRRPFSFQRTGEDARLEARFLPSLATGAIAVLCGLAVLAVGWFLAKRGVSVGLFALFAATAGLVFYPSAAPGLRPSFAAMVAAAALLAIAAQLHAAWRRRRGGDEGSETAPIPEPTKPSEPRTEEKQP
jgi:hypothetical protein